MSLSTLSMTRAATYSLGSSSTIVCPVILRRRHPADWEAGLPEDVQSFASHYEVYLQVEPGDENEVSLSLVRCTSQLISPR